MRIKISSLIIFSFVTNLLSTLLKVFICDKKFYFDIFFIGDKITISLLYN